jgi:hypothetical protein
MSTARTNPPADNLRKSRLVTPFDLFRRFGAVWVTCSGHFFCISPTSAINLLRANQIARHVLYHSG